MISYCQSGSNEIHNLVVKDITDNSWQDNPYVTLKCTGYILRELGSRREIDRISYSCIVRVYGDLMGYATNELAVGDMICVIGHSDTALLDGRFKTRVTVADQIFKSDWLHYYNRI